MNQFQQNWYQTKSPGLANKRWKYGLKITRQPRVIQNTNVTCRVCSPCISANVLLCCKCTVHVQWCPFHMYSEWSVILPIVLYFWETKSKVTSTYLLISPKYWAKTNHTFPGHVQRFVHNSGNDQSKKCWRGDECGYSDTQTPRSNAHVLRTHTHHDERQQRERLQSAIVRACDS